MGQQQLLLVILVTILVGIATVVAMNVFGGAAEDANRDAVRQDMLQGATAAQAIYTRPTMLDGAGGNFLDVTGVDADDTDDALLQRLGMPITDDNGTWGNENGTYSVTEVTGHSFTIEGVPSSGGPPIRATVTYSEDGSGDFDEGWNIVWTPGGGDGT